MESKYKSSAINLGSIRNLHLKCNTVVSFIDLSIFSIEQNVVPLMIYRKIVTNGSCEKDETDNSHSNFVIVR